MTLTIRQGKSYTAPIGASGPGQTRKVRNQIAVAGAPAGVSEAIALATGAVTDATAVVARLADAPAAAGTGDLDAAAIGTLMKPQRRR